MGETGPRQLVLLVEGHGDVAAAPVLVKRLLKEKHVSEALVLDPHPIRIGGFGALSGSAANRHRWLGYLGTAAKRPRTHSVLAMLDGDAGSCEGGPFCATKAAMLLAARSREAGAGRLFSLACVFACCEFESWLIAGVRSLAGRLLPDSRQGIYAGTSSDELNTEVAPRDAKRWLSEHMPRGYKPTQDQAALTEMVSLDEIRKCGLRSFRRLENAIDLLVRSAREGTPIVSPA